MPITVSLQDENGKEVAFVGVPQGAPLDRGLSRAVGPRFPWASTIDPYGDTTFNYIQAGLLRKEWVILIQEAEDGQTKEVLRKVDEFLESCASERHLYVKFIGD